MNLDLAITYADVPNFPAGSAVAHILASITGAVTPVVTQIALPGAATISFANVPADTYTYSVSGVDVSNNTFGTAVTGTFTVTAPATVTLFLPATVTATQS